MSIGSIWVAREPRELVPSIADLQYTPDDLSQYVNTSAYFRPWAMRAACPPDPPGQTSWCHLGVNASGGNGYYGLLETSGYSPVASGQCDVGPHSTVGTLCDLPHVFSFVFPAVVGMMEGANLSGDLADPGKSIPIGTVAAVSTAFGCYLLLIFGQAGTMDRGALQYDQYVLQESCVSQYFVVLGNAAACLSTALGSMFGSARIMQALARDRIYPPLRVFATGALDGDEPRRALVLTYLLAQAGLFYGGIDALAPVLTNFFLVTYTLTNVSAALLELTSVPNFRPSWRIYSWHTSLLGAGLTVAAMLFLNVAFALVTLALVCVLLVYIYATFDASNWADISEPLAFVLARRAMRTLSRSPRHPKFWRPNMLLVLPPPKPSTAPPPSLPLLQLASQLSFDAMLLPATAVVARSANGGECISALDAMAAEAALREHLAIAASISTSLRLPPLAHMHPRCAVGSSMRLALVNLALGAAVGPIQPDTVALPLPDSGAVDGVVCGDAELTLALSELHAMRKNVLLVANAMPPEGGAGGEGGEASVRHEPPLPSPLDGASLARKGRAARIDIWLLGDLPFLMPMDGAPLDVKTFNGSAAAAATASTTPDGEAMLDVSLAMQFGYLSHRALRRTSSRFQPAPRVRVLQLLPSAAGGDGSRPDGSINQAGGSITPLGVQTLDESPLGAQCLAAGLGVASEGAHAALRAWLRELRIEAEVVVLAPTSDRYTRDGARGDAMRALSADAALVLLPLPAFGANHGAALAEESASASTGASAPAAGEVPSAGVLAALAELTRGLPPTVLCKSGGEPVVTTDI